MDRKEHQSQLVGRDVRDPQDDACCRPRRTDQGVLRGSHQSAEPFPLIWENNIGLRTFELQNSQVVLNNLHQANNANVCSFYFAHVEPTIINDAIAAFGGGVAPVALMRAPSPQLIEQPALEVAQRGEEGIGAESLAEDAVNRFDSSHQMVLTKEGDKKLTSTSAAVGETALDVADEVSRRQ